MRYRNKTSILNKGFAVLLILILLFGLIPQILSAAYVENNQEQMNTSPSTRSQSRAGLIVDSDFTLSSSTSKPWVWVRNNATLTIPEGIKLDLTSDKGRLNVTDNGTVIVRGQLDAYYISANCKSFQIDGGWVICNNKRTVGGVGLPTEITIHTKDGIELSNKAKIECTGQKGSSGYIGYDARVELQSNSYISITGGSTIESKGGDGGQGSNDIKSGGNGAQGSIILKANGTATIKNSTKQSAALFITDSTLEARGGRGGDTKISGGDGGDGGLGKIRIETLKESIVIEKCEMISAFGGDGGSCVSTTSDRGQKGDAELFVKSNKFYVDDYKKDDPKLWLDPSSSFIKLNGEYNTFNIEAKGGAYLYTPVLYNTLPITLDTQTTIYIYNFLQVTVEDHSRQKLPGAAITVKLGSATEGSGTTNAGGQYNFLLLAYQITKSVKNDDALQAYTVSASLSGVKETVSNVNLPDQFNQLTVKLALVAVTIDNIIYGGKSYMPVNKLEVGDLVTLEGNASSGAGAIESVTVDIFKATEKIINKAAAEDIADVGNEAFSRWRYDLDTTQFNNNDVVKIEVTAKTEKFANTANVTLKINQEIIPDPPKVTITDLNISEGKYFTDTENLHFLMLEGTASDDDWKSTILTSSQFVDQIRIIIKNGSGHIVLSEILTLDHNDPEVYDQDTGKYTWSFKWETRKWSATTEDYVYPAGVYTIHVRAYDDTKPESLESDEQTITVELTHTGRAPSKLPTAVIKSITAGKNVEFVNYKYDEMTKTAVFKFKSEKGKSDVTINFDLSESYDKDGPDDELTYQVKIGGQGISGTWQDSPLIKFEVFEYVDEKEEISYTMQIKVKDKYDWENKKLQLIIDENTGEDVLVNNLTIKIEFIPEDPPYKTPLAEIFSLELHHSEIHILFFILIIVFNLIGIMLITSKFKKISKRSKAREIALRTSKQKQLEESAKKSEDIYSHLEFVDDESDVGSGQVAVAGATAVSQLSEEELNPTISVDQLAHPDEPEAPKLVSAGQPIFESDVKVDSIGTVAPPTTTALAPVQLQPGQPAMAQAQTQPQLQQPVPAVTTPTAAPAAATATPTSTSTSTPVQAQIAQKQEQQQQ